MMQRTLDNIVFSSAKKRKADDDTKNQRNQKPDTRSRNLDQFYTKDSVARDAVQHLLQMHPTLATSAARWIEPSVGNGAFYRC